MRKKDVRIRPRSDIQQPAKGVIDTNQLDLGSLPIDNGLDPEYIAKGSSENFEDTVAKIQEHDCETLYIGDWDYNPLISPEIRPMDKGYGYRAIMSFEKHVTEVHWSKWVIASGKGSPLYSDYGVLHEPGGIIAYCFPPSCYDEDSEFGKNRVMGVRRTNSMATPVELTLNTDLEHTSTSFMLDLEVYEKLEEEFYNLLDKYSNLSFKGDYTSCEHERFRKYHGDPTKSETVLQVSLENINKSS